jgi:RNA polymerase sigma factor for flagellar operon FliA
MRYVRSVEQSERARLVERHADLAKKLAQTLHNRVREFVAYDELLAMANAGLVEAAHRYDESHGAAFSTFAWYRIHGAMIDGIRKQSNLPRRAWAQLVALRGAHGYLESRGEQEAAAAKTGAPPREAKSALEALRAALSAVKAAYVLSLDALAERGFDKASDEAPLADQLDTSRLAAKLRAALDQLPAKERALVTKHYFEGKNLQDAGTELGISKSWASRMHAQAVDRLRVALERES